MTRFKVVTFRKILRKYHPQPGYSALLIRERVVVDGDTSVGTAKSIIHGTTSETSGLTSRSSSMSHLLPIKILFTATSACCGRAIAE